MYRVAAVRKNRENREMSGNQKIDQGIRENQEISKLVRNFKYIDKKLKLNHLKSNCSSMWHHEYCISRAISWRYNL